LSGSHLGRLTAGDFGLDAGTRAGVVIMKPAESLVVIMCSGCANPVAAGSVAGSTEVEKGD
jgi:hypothetical protein